MKNLCAFALVLLLFGSCIVPCFGSVDSGNVAFYEMSEGSGIVLSDSTTNEFDGGISGATWCSGKNGYGLHFDGTNDYASAFLSGEDVDAITVSLWIYPESFAGGNARYIANGGWGEGDGQYLIYCSGSGSGRVYAVVRFGVTDYVAYYDVLTINNWYHLVAIFPRNAAVRLYINLVKGEDSATVPNSVNLHGLDWTELSWSTNPFYGAMDENRVYNRALTMAEIAELYLWAPGVIAISVDWASFALWIFASLILLVFAVLGYLFHPIAGLFGVVLGLFVCAWSLSLGTNMIQALIPGLLTVICAFVAIREH